MERESEKGEWKKAKEKERESPIPSTTSRASDVLLRDDPIPWTQIIIAFWYFRSSLSIFFTMELERMCTQ